MNWSWYRSEDTLAVIVGFLIIGLSLGSLSGADWLGWVVSAKVWTDPSQALTPAGKTFAGMSGFVSLILTFIFMLTVLTAGAWFLGEQPGRFASRFTILFFLAFACWTAGHYARIAATPDKMPAGIDWSLGLTGEAGYLVALLGGLLIGNFSPALAVWFSPAARSELYIKTAIVIIGANLGAKASEATGLASAIMFRGFAAIVEAYLIYWALVYLLARTAFGFSREWAAPLASGISICGVSAAITTGAAIRARPIVPVMVSSLVVIFSVIEMLVLPALAKTYLSHEPLVAAAWMGLAVKTDGAAISSGAITAAMVLPNDENGRNWMQLTTTTVKVFIDLFIGVWAILLALIWVLKIDRRSEECGLPLGEIWARFPKFVFGYLLTFLGFLAIGLTDPATIRELKTGTDQADQVRRLLFVLTFFSIGMSANFRRLWAEGLGKLALVYVVSLFGFVIWIGLVISWLFFAGVQPPPPAS